MIDDRHADEVDDGSNPGAIALEDIGTAHSLDASSKSLDSSQQLVAGPSLDTALAAPVPNARREKKEGRFSFTEKDKAIFTNKLTWIVAFFLLLYVSAEGKQSSGPTFIRLCAYVCLAVTIGKRVYIILIWG